MFDEPCAVGTITCIGKRKKVRGFLGNRAGGTTLPEREEERLGRLGPIVGSKASREGAPAVGASPPRTPSENLSVASGAPPAAEVTR